MPEVLLDRYQDYLAAIEHPEIQFSLATFPDFPYSEYANNLTRYSEMEDWYSGYKLKETSQVSGKKVETYPIQANPLKGAVQKHTHFLFGEVQQDDRPLVFPRLVFGDDEAKKELAKEAEQVLLQVWNENNGRALQWENGARCQIYGGCIFKLVWEPEALLHTIPILIESVHPKCFVGLPDSTNPWMLREAWTVTPISPKEAQDNGFSYTSQKELWLIEHWTRSTYDAWINGQGVQRFFDGGWHTVSGANEWGFVPLIYIPHIRVTGFYGENMLDAVTGLVKEYNLRLADYGDAVTVDAHSYLGMRNVNGAPTVQQVAPNYYAINLGSTPNITGQEAQPDLFEIRKPSASTPMKDLTQELYAQFRRDAFVPAVLDGEDEGSQRSGLTLAMRALSLTSHTDTERIFWSTGLDLLNRMILEMLKIKGEAKITDKHLALRIKEAWAPVLPRDREMTVTEAISRMGAKLGSPEHLLELLGDVEDIDEEVKLIIKFWKEITEAVAKGQAEGNPMGAFGGPGGPGKPGQSPSVGGSPAAKGGPAAKGVSPQPTSSE